MDRNSRMKCLPSQDLFHDNILDDSWLQCIFLQIPYTLVKESPIPLNEKRLKKIYLKFIFLYYQ